MCLNKKSTVTEYLNEFHEKTEISVYYLIFFHSASIAP